MNKITVYIVLGLVVLTIIGGLVLAEGIKIQNIETIAPIYCATLPEGSTSEDINTFFNSIEGARLWEK